MWKELRSNAAFTVAIIGTTASMNIAMTCAQYGSMLLENCYSDQGRPMNEAKDRIAYLNLYGDILSSISFFFVGYLCDKVTIWKLLTVCNLFILGFHLVFVLDMSPDVC